MFLVKVTFFDFSIDNDNNNITENISTLARRPKLYRCQTPWVRFIVEPLMEFSSFNTYRSFKKHEKVIYIAHSNTIYPWFLSKTKPKLFVLHRHRSRCLTSLYILKYQKGNFIPPIPSDEYFLLRQCRKQLYK